MQNLVQHAKYNATLNIKILCSGYFFGKLLMGTRCKSDIYSPPVFVLINNVQHIQQVLYDIGPMAERYMYGIIRP